MDNNLHTPPVALSNWKWIALLGLVIAASFWKVLFTNQYSIITGWEGTNQAYSWYSFAAKTIQKGVLPAWDPYTLSGHSYIGETQTGLFYPLKALLYFAPMKDGALSERAFHQAFVLAHLLAGIFMFYFVCELGVLNRFAAFLAGICYSLGGFLGHQHWVHQLDSAIWLPLVLIFLLRALRAKRTDLMVLFCSLSGIFLGISLLAGSIHIPMANVFVVVSTAAYFSVLQARQRAASEMTDAKSLVELPRSASIILLIGIVSFAVASVQLLPSMEYAQLAKRWTVGWAGPFHDRIPYHVTAESFNLGPQGIFALLFGGAPFGRSEFSPYFGVFPLVLVALAIWTNWKHAWVRYFTVVGALAFLYSMGSYFLPHGLLYLIVPFMDKLWEAGRFLYLTHFAMAVLVAFGVEALFSLPETSPEAAQLKRVFKWIVLALAAVLSFDALNESHRFGEWAYFSFLLIVGTWALLMQVTGRNQSRLIHVMIASLIVCDLYAFNWMAQSKVQVEQTGTNYLKQTWDTKPLAQFLNSQPGPFRVQLDLGDDGPKSMGDVYGVQTVEGWGASMLVNYSDNMFAPVAPCLLNVRYIIAKTGQRNEPVVFSSGNWQIHQHPSGCPRGWIVHRAEVGKSEPAIIKAVQQTTFDPREVALLSEPLQATLVSPTGTEDVVFHKYMEDGFELEATASATGLLVISEMYYPGWTATINGQPAQIHKVDGLLRGVVVEPGKNHIKMQYQPWTIRLGFVLSGSALLATIFLAGLISYRGRKVTTRGQT